MIESLKRAVKAALRPLFRPLLVRIDLPLRVLQPQVDAAHAAIAAIDAAIDAAIGRLDAANGVLVNRVKDLEHESAHDKQLIAALRAENQNFMRGWLQLRTDLLRLQQSSGKAAMPRHCSQDRATDTSALETRP